MPLRIRAYRHAIICRSVLCRMQLGFRARRQAVSSLVSSMVTAGGSAALARGARLAAGLLCAVSKAARWPTVVVGECSAFSRQCLTMAGMPDSTDADLALATI
jgi:deferrochelatase/peroxidase EfeB